MPGIVHWVGDGVADLVPGQEVYALIASDRDGAAAEYVAVRATDLAPQPASVGHAGAYVVQLAHQFGARVTATTTSRDLTDYVEALGADEVLIGDLHGS